MYYGWTVLLLAAAAMVGTLPGRTQGLGLVTEPLLADLGIGRVEYAQLNLWATLIGSVFAIGIGRFIDRLGTRVVLTTVALALGAVVVVMSGVQSFWALAIAVTLTRGLGQSALSVISLAMVGQWFVRRIDPAMAIYSIVMSIGFMIAFPARRLARAVARLALRVAGDRHRVDRGARAIELVFARHSPESIGWHPMALATPVTPVAPGRRNLARSPDHAGLLDFFDRRRALRPRRVRHRPLQRIDPRRARLWPECLLPDPRRHGDDRAGRQLRRRLAGDAHAAAERCWRSRCSFSRWASRRCRTSPRSCT